MRNADLMAGTESGGDRNFADTVLAQVDLEQYAGSLRRTNGSS